MKKADKRKLAKLKAKEQAESNYKKWLIKRQAKIQEFWKHGINPFTGF